MHNGVPRRLVAAALSITALGVAACGSSSSSDKSSTTKSSGSGAKATAAQHQLAPYLKPPTQLTVTTPLSKKPPTGKSVYFVTNGAPISNENGKGVAAAAKALGWKFKTISVDQNNPSTIASGMLSAINAGADVVFIGATPTAEYKSVLPAAKAKGTLIIDNASGNAPVPGVTAYINNAPASGPAWGKLAALVALANAEKAGTTLHGVIPTSPGFATILGPADATIKATIAEKCPKCTVDTLNIGLGQVFSGKGPAAVVSYLQGHPEVNYILEDASLIDQGLTQALKAASLDKVKVIGITPLGPQVEALKSGAEEAWVAISLQVQGWMMIDAAARKFVGDDPTVYNKVAAPSYVITKDDPNKPIDVPADYAAQFKKMWNAR